MRAGFVVVALRTFYFSGLTPEKKEPEGAHEDAQEGTPVCTELLLRPAVQRLQPPPHIGGTCRLQVGVGRQCKAMMSLAGTLVVGRATPGVIIHDAAVHGYRYIEHSDNDSQK